MSDTYVSIDPAGNPVLMPLRKARKVKAKRKPPTRAELGLAPAPKAKPSEPELSAAVQAAADEFYANYEARRAAFFSSTVDGRDPLAPEVRHRGEILFSDNGGSGKGSSQSKGAMTIAEAAEQAGLTEAEMTTRLVGKARMKMVKGELVVSVADVNRLAKAGKLPNPGKVAKAKQATAEAEGTASTDPAVEARSKAQAEAIGVDIGPAEAAAPRAGVTTARPSDCGRRRLGAPQRWTAAR